MASGTGDKQSIDLTAYDVVLASDVINDAMHLEVNDKGGDLVLIVTRWDVDGRMTISTVRHDVPLELVEWAIERAKQRLA